MLSDAQPSDVPGAGDAEDPFSPSGPAPRRMVSADSEHGHEVVVESVARSGRAMSRRAVDRASADTTEWACKSCVTHATTLEPGTTKYQAYLSWLTLGIVYGDIGTSPLYTFSSIFASGPPVESDVIGALSAMIWSLLLITTSKYLVFVLMADDHGEGGTFAIYALLARGLRKKVKNDATFAAVNTALATLALVGVSMVFSDGVLTPAISVLGAIAGLEIVSPAAASAVIPVTCVILVVLFMVQYKGTERVSFMFSPVITLWFLANASFGIYNISRAPQVLVAFSPSYAIEFFVDNGYNGFVALGAIFLTVTGSEAMFADLGHFNAKAMRTSAFCFVIPALLLTYCGQAAAIVEDPTIVSNTFYLSVPNWALIPMLVLATMAAIIASQAMISASFSIISQAIRLQCFPRMTIHETSKYQLGQVYVPEINYFYMVMVIIVVAAYQNATALGYAYGVAVSSVLIITTCLYAGVMVCNWGRHWILALCFCTFFGFIEAAFLGANLLKFATGGWFAIVLTIIFSCILATWRWGRMTMVEHQHAMSVDAKDLFNVVQTTALGGGVPGSTTAMRVLPRSAASVVPAVEVVTVPSSLILCFASSAERIPATYVHFLRRLPARPQYLVFVTVTAVNVPYVVSDLHFAPLGEHDHVYRVVFNYGYAEQPPDACTLAVRVMRLINRGNDSVDGKLATDGEVIVEPTFMLGHDSVYARAGSSTLHRARVGFFNVLLAAARHPATTLNMPANMVLEVGVQVAI